jgi:hypothetical protein
LIVAECRVGSLFSVLFRSVLAARVLVCHLRA